MVFEFVNKVKMESLDIERKPNAGRTYTDMGKMYAPTPSVQSRSAITLFRPQCIWGSSSHKCHTY
jgi:hypothetical protein